jgi:hypothetical protein
MEAGSQSTGQPLLVATSTLDIYDFLMEAFSAWLRDFEKAMKGSGGGVMECWGDGVLECGWRRTGERVRRGRFFPSLRSVGMAI